MTASQVKKARKLLGLTQLQMAEKLGWSSCRNVVYLEKSQRTCQMQTALAIECLLMRAEKMSEFE